MEEHREIKRKKPHILFATPGRLNDHLDKENINAQYVSWLIIDEFDKCLDMGFEKEMEKAVETLSYVKRRILLSATTISGRTTTTTCLSSWHHAEPTIPTTLPTISLPALS